MRRPGWNATLSWRGILETERKPRVNIRPADSPPAQIQPGLPRRDSRSKIIFRIHRFGLQCLFAVTWSFSILPDFGRDLIFIHFKKSRLRRKGTAAAMLALAAIFAPVISRDSAPKGREILVAAAVSLKDAFKEIGSMYESQTGVRVRFNLGASGLLQKQIETGAPVDVFASAGEKQMDELQARGLIIAETRRDFTRNDLVLIVPAHSRLPIRSFADLVRPEVSRVAMGNPKTVPAGQYAREALTKTNVWPKLQFRIVLAENVRQVLDYVARGEVEAGLVYATDVAAAHGKVSIAAYAPKGAHGPILYPIAIVKEAEDRSNAQRFIDLTLSDAGQAVLRKYNFLSPR
jgi:molybdate transport system substrate-binding protein